MYSIVYFDGVCGLCNKTVDFLLRIDKSDRLRFAPLQSEYARQNLNLPPTENFDTIIFQSGNKTWNRSSAILKILSVTGGIWRLTIIFYLVPAFLRDAIYNLIANNRYKWFGKKSECRIPTPTEREKFFL